MATPAGWYTDPGGSENERYWDGDRWTEHLRPIPAAAPDAGWGEASWSPGASPTVPAMGPGMGPASGPSSQAMGWGPTGVGPFDAGGPGHGGFATTGQGGGFDPLGPGAMADPGTGSALRFPGDDRSGGTGVRGGPYDEPAPHRRGGLGGLGALLRTGRGDGQGRGRLIGVVAVAIVALVALAVFSGSGLGGSDDPAKTPSAYATAVCPKMAQAAADLDEALNQDGARGQTPQGAVRSADAWRAYETFFADLGGALDEAGAPSDGAAQVSMLRGALEGAQHTAAALGEQAGIAVGASAVGPGVAALKAEAGFILALKDAGPTVAVLAALGADPGCGPAWSALSTVGG